jgi:hypothetical protein
MHSTNKHGRISGDRQIQRFISFVTQLFARLPCCALAEQIDTAKKFT